MPWWIRCARIAQILWLFYEASYLIMLVNADGCKDMIFKVTLEGKALANHVFKKVPTAINDRNCQSMCFQDDRCISYNFGTSASGVKYMCELSESDHIMNPEDLVEIPGNIYRSAENTCNCSKTATCRFNFVDGTHRCECKPGFVGDDCAEFNPCANATCLNGGTCINTDRSLYQNGYTCNCSQRYAGRSCEIGVYLDTKKLSWDDVQNACEAKDESMQLPSIHSDEENERIRNLTQDTQGTLVFIGLKKIDEKWVWSDGSKNEYRNWDHYTLNLDCVFMEKQSGKWKTSRCSHDLTYFYLCATVKSGTADN